MSRTPSSGAQARVTQKPNATVLIVAAVLGVIAAGAYILHVQSIYKAVDQGTFVVYTVNRSYEPGDKIKFEEVVQTQVPDTDQMRLSFKHMISDASMKDRTNLNEKLSPTVVQQSIATNELLMHKHFVASESNATLRLAKGRRLIALSVDRDSVPPILQPGNYVDVSLVVLAGGQSIESMLVIERVKVLAVGSQTAGSTERKSRTFSTVSIEVEPEEADLLNTINRKRGKTPFTIAVRNVTDSERRIPGGGINPDLLDAMGIDP